jgi:pilus assembly protein CpaD
MSASDAMGASQPKYPAEEAASATQSASLTVKTAALGFMLCVAGALAGCGTDYASSDPAFPGDIEARHPIALVSAPTSLDIYPNGGRLDARTLANLKDFAARYRKFGSGQILILTPGRNGADQSVVSAIRAALANGGAGARIGVSSYWPTSGDRAPPIRVAFVGLEAKVATPCGVWPEDLASGSSLEGWKNEPYANFGCATQAVIAAQVDDPRDFVEPRALGLSDGEMRIRAIQNVRKGQDPGTTWATGLTPIGGGSN